MTRRGRSRWHRTLAESGHAVSYKPTRAAIGEGADNFLPDLVCVESGSREWKVMAERRSPSSVGMIALRCGGWGDDTLRGAAMIDDNPSDLLARFDSFPFHVPESS